ncbi:hypothetical protein H012_gp159 [Acanthamoeba polyphaga moumouvirus]|uniref:Uncharacterized protein n=2 Tax=Moumouvirus TaxID=3080801 RepID=L7RDC4_9VIRU|nr:hypothetical protein H012_gp159 [Acanthamoeba polyphaga moumouvirus]AEX62359.1 hypothetical protein mv_L154 [Moumouvirus Monve]AGC02291.1 hypothetical protein Moumou_00773 [Acanthamoeba polyphaga moumouvirus]AQN68633.1 hypothetical protein [Saudi moumouvirus]
MDTQQVIFNKMNQRLFDALSTKGYDCILSEQTSPVCQANCFDFYDYCLCAKKASYFISLNKLVYILTNGAILHHSDLQKLNDYIKNHLEKLEDVWINLLPERLFDINIKVFLDGECKYDLQKMYMFYVEDLATIVPFVIKFIQEISPSLIYQNF